MTMNRLVEDYNRVGRRVTANPQRPTLFGKVTVKRIRTEMRAALEHEWRYSVLYDLIAALYVWQNDSYPNRYDRRERAVWYEWLGALRAWNVARDAYMLSHGFDSQGWPIDFETRERCASGS